MPKRELSHEGLLMLNAALLLAGRKDVRSLVRYLCSLELSPGAGPTWDLLRGAMLANVRVGEAHPQRRDLRLALERAILLAREEGQPHRVPAPAGGGLRNFSKDA